MGTQAIRVLRIGYRPTTVSDLLINPGRPTQVEVQLETAAATLAATRVVAGNASFVAPRNTPASRITMSYEEIRRAPGAIGDVSRLVQAMPGVLTGNARATTSSPVAAARWRICSSWTDSKCRT